MTETILSGLPSLVPSLYLGILAIISFYGLHKLLMVWRFYRHRHLAAAPLQQYAETELPTITVQLPIFNEMYVIERLLEAVCQLDYPEDKLDIQVLDDSLDETQKICQAKVLDLQKKHPNIHYIHRPDRWGFKAGALDHGLQFAKGELIIIFDADFIPTSDTLLKMVHHFSDPAVGMVQARWTHLNRNYSLLTEIQALMLDGHFVIEQTARNRSGCFFNFNGTAGIWRLKAIQDAGGWQHTTVTEDLDLSYRVQLRGWRCIYLPDVVVPAELPMEMNAFKSQQFRWAKGASQVATKLLPTIFRSDIPLYVKVESFLHMTNNINYVFLLVILLLSLPYHIYIAENHWEQDLFIYLPIFVGTTLNLLCFYLVSQYEQGIRQPSWKFMSDIFFLMSIGVGLSINQSLAVCEGFFQVDSEFIRTPKHGIVNNTENWITKKYRAAKTWTIMLEFSMLAYLTLTLGLAIYYQHYWSLPFLILFSFGYFYVLRLSLFQHR
jgi:cellulose synthase/poly-beta-1,6-N-acetylglucosamine synthase-like glycosyltransferase